MEPNTNPLKWAKRQLIEAGVDTPDRDAIRLFEHCLQRPIYSFQASEFMALDSETIGTYREMIRQRCRRTPVAKIVGYKEFWSRKFAVNTHVLDPRPETETLVEHALEEEFQTVLDLGTGSGCILVSLLDENKKAVGVGTDISNPALLVARDNARTHDVHDRALFVQTSWFAGIKKNGFDLIVANPPYITATEYSELCPEVRFYEPAIALKLGHDGLEAFQEIAKGAHHYLKENGRLVVEVGYRQDRAVREVFRSGKLTHEHTLTDLDGRNRGLGFRKLRP